MKKLLAILLALAMVLSLAACGAKNEEPQNVTVAPTDPAPSDPAPTDPVVTVEPGTSWNAIEGYHREEDPTSVWQYYFFDPQDSSYNQMMRFLDHEDIDIHSWYPWEGSWVGIGFNNGEFCNVYGNLMEQNADGPTGMMSVLGFHAPADGKYVVTGKLMNAFDQEPDLYTVVKDDGTIVTQENFRDYIKGAYTFLTPTEVELKAGEILYFQCGSTNGWVSSYADITVHYEPTDPAVMEKPESVEYTPAYPEMEISATAGLYNAAAELNTESATDGVWTYSITSDGITFEPMTVLVEQQWDDDPELDAIEWYSAPDDYVGVGTSFDMGAELFEINACEDGRSAALGFKAPEDGVYSFTVITKNLAGQAADKFLVNKGGEIVAEVPFSEFGNAQIVDVALAAGETVYFYGQAGEEWVSFYANVIVNQYGASMEFNTESCTDGVWVYSTTSDGVAFEPMSYFDEPQWDDDPEADASQWYNDSGVGVGFNYDVANYLEVNSDAPFTDGGTAAALGFKAPAAGTYELTICTLNAWGQAAEGIVVSIDGELVATVEFLDIAFSRTVTVTLEEGQIAYVYGLNGGEWDSFYMNIGANLVG